VNSQEILKLEMVEIRAIAPTVKLKVHTLKEPGAKFQERPKN